MIFATDLDRTLIYSEKFIEDYKEETLNIEIYNGKPISYISREALRLLIVLDGAATIIPVTTRNYEQYHRIKIFKDYIKPKVYIINNGGTIYIDDREDEKWSEHIQEQLRQLSLSYDEVLANFLGYYSKPIVKYKKSDNLIWLIVGEELNMDLEAVEIFKAYIEGTGWKIDVSGRKIYIYPECINKWAALKYIKEIYAQKMIIAAGDSFLDYEMLCQADEGIIPKGAWLEDLGNLSVYVTFQSGLGAAEDILNFALSKTME